MDCFINISAFQKPIQAAVSQQYGHTITKNCSVTWKELHISMWSWFTSEVPPHDQDRQVCKCAIVTTWNQLQLRGKKCEEMATTLFCFYIIISWSLKAAVFT